MLEHSLEMNGHIEKRRIFIRLFFYALNKEYVFRLDTGCTFNLIIYKEYQEELQLIDDTELDQQPALLADGSKVFYNRKWARIGWFGTEKAVIAHVPKRDRPIPEGYQINPEKGYVYDDGTAGILGTGLLETVFIDFVSNTFSLRKT